MPKDAMVVWVRGNTLFARAAGDRDHVVRIPADKPELLMRALRQRSVFAAHTQRETAPSSPEKPILQADIDAWSRAGNKVKALPRANGITGTIVVENKQERERKAIHEMWQLLAE